MISPITTVANSSAGLVPTEYDPTQAVMSTGTITMKRAKRDGRNPSTGARTSRRFGQTVTFETNLLPLTNTINENLY